MTSLGFTRTGSGAPLVLLHGLGLSRHTWSPVLPALTERFDVIAVDLPGFGDSPPLPPSTAPHPVALARSVAAFLDELGIGTAHLAGNSLGGWVALELAKSRPTASVTLLSPAGLWRRDTPLYCLVSLRTSRWLARHAGGPLSRLLAYRLGRLLVLGQSQARAAAVPVEHARAVIRDVGTCTAFDAALKATTRSRYRSGAPIDAPVTVAFGAQDHLLLRRQSRHLGELPPGTRIGELPGCGHVPMADNPAAVTALITAAAATRRPAGRQSAHEPDLDHVERACDLHEPCAAQAGADAQVGMPTG